MDFRGDLSPASIGWQSLQLPPDRYHDRVSEGQLDWWAKVWIGRHVTDSIAELTAERDRLKREIATYRSDRFGWQLDAKAVQVDQHLLQIAEELLKLKQSPPLTLASNQPPPPPVSKPPAHSVRSKPETPAHPQPHRPPAKPAPRQDDAIKRLHDGLVKAYENDPRIQNIKQLQDDAVAARGKLADLVKQVRDPQGREVSDKEVTRAIGEVLSTLHAIAKQSDEVEKGLNVKTKGKNEWFWKRMGINQSTGIEDIADAAAAVQDRTVDGLEKKYAGDGDQPLAPTTRDQRRADLAKALGNEKQLQELGHNQHKSPQGLIAKVVEVDRADIEKQLDDLVSRIEADPTQVKQQEIDKVLIDLTTGARQAQVGGLQYTNPQAAARRISEALSKGKQNAANGGAGP